MFAYFTCDNKSIYEENVFVSESKAVKESFVMDVGVQHLPSLLLHSCTAQINVLFCFGDLSLLSLCCFVLTVCRRNIYHQSSHSPDCLPWETVMRVVELRQAVLSCYSYLFLCVCACVSFFPWTRTVHPPL